jgi:MFS family permease
MAATVTLTQSTPAIPSVNRTAATLGFWSGIWAAAMAVGFLLAVVIGAIVFPSPEWTGDAAAFAASLDHPLAWSIGEIFSLLLIPGWVALAVAIHTLAPREKKPLTLMALVFTAAYAATVGANDIVQITTVRLNLEAGSTEGLGLWIKNNPISLFFSLEMFGYAWQSFAVVLAGLVFAGAGIRRWIRWLFGAVAVSGVMGLVAGWVGLDFLHPFTMAGSALWGVAFPTGAVLCAVVFRRLGTTPPGPLATTAVLSAGAEPDS